MIAYLTVSKTEVPFRTLEEMVSQGRYKFGTKYGTVYYNAFEVSTYAAPDPTFSVSASLAETRAERQYSTGL